MVRHAGYYHLKHIDFRNVKFKYVVNLKIFLIIDYLGANISKEDKRKKFHRWHF
jgi:hypothetical protein